MPVMTTEAALPSLWCSRQSLAAGTDIEIDLGATLFKNSFRRPLYKCIITIAREQQNTRIFGKPPPKKLWALFRFCLRRRVAAPVRSLHRGFWVTSGRDLGRSHKRRVVAEYVEGLLHIHCNGSGNKPYLTCFCQRE